MSDFKRLRVWQAAHALSLHVHRVTTRIRNPQFASLRSQAFRASMSIPATIAEGRRQTSDAQFGRYLGYALNSASELEYHLIVARDTRIITEDEFGILAAQTISVRKMLYTLINRLTPEPKRTAKKRERGKRERGKREPRNREPRKREPGKHEPGKHEPANATPDSP